MFYIIYSLVLTLLLYYVTNKVTVHRISAFLVHYIWGTLERQRADEMLGNSPHKVIRSH